jgi:hypothetical protein
MLPLCLIQLISALNVFSCFLDSRFEIASRLSSDGIKQKA